MLLPLFTRVPSPWLPRLPAVALSGLSDSRELHGRPCAPQLPSGAVLIRYIYDGGTLAQGRLCTLLPEEQEAVSGLEVVRALHDDGVDLTRFYPAAYWLGDGDQGGWLPFLRHVTDPSRADQQGEDVRIDLVAPSEGEADEEEEQRTTRRKRSWSHAPISAPVRRRVDVKLYRRGQPTVDQVTAEAAAGPGAGGIGRGRYYAIGIVGAKNEQNTGTLWRSAYQLGSAFIFTVLWSTALVIGTRYRAQATDTLNTRRRLPLFSLNDWNDFAEFAPEGAVWVAVEMGGTSLEDFEHPDRAIYLLGSEDAGLPKSVVQACHKHVQLPAERYESYNVAMAGSIVMYDRIAKERARAKAEGREQPLRGTDS